MKMIDLYLEAVRKRQGNRRWVNVAFVIVLVLLLVAGMAGDEQLSTLWPFMILLGIFAVQWFWSSILGWLLTIISWLFVAFGAFFYERVVFGVRGFSGAFLFLWGILPALVLCFFMPRAGERSLKDQK